MHAARLEDGARITEKRVYCDSSYTCGFWNHAKLKDGEVAQFVTTRAFCAALLVFGLVACSSQTNTLSTAGMSFDSFVETLETIATGDDVNALDALWSGLLADGRVPFVEGEEVAFLYRGSAQAVSWIGDFTDWERGEPLPGRRVATSDVWVATTSFPVGARLDYQIVVDGTAPILDPANPVQQWGGYGPKSVLAMPGYGFPETVVERAGVARGSLSEPAALPSRHLGYAVTYQVYTPAGYENLAALPVIYLADGHEFADPRAGAMPIVLDNLIAARAMEPVIAVFIDPRDPETGQNRREAEFLSHGPYQAFIATELVPLIDRTYRSDPTPARRAIAGVSFGAVNAAATGLQHPDVFHLVGMLSPCFVNNRLYAGYRDATELPHRVFLSTGRPWDCDASTIKRLLERKGVALQYAELPEGHSWGQWRSLEDDMLIDFFGTTE